MTIVWKIPFPTSTQMLLALKLADHAKDDGTHVFPGKDSLSKRARCSLSTVKTTLRLMREAGILVVVREGGQKGPHDTTEYKFDVALLERLARGEVSISGSSSEMVLGCGEHSGETGSKIDPLNSTRVADGSLPGQSSAATRSAHNPQTLSEPKEEPSRTDALATRSAARPSLIVTSKDLSWVEWLDKIEATQGEGARFHVTALGKLTVAARWPRDNVPVPRIDVPRNPAGGGA